MSRGAGGLAGNWAQAQRQQQRQYEAQQRERAAYEREQTRQRQAAARAGREQQAQYRREREAEAQRRTAELDGRVAELSGLLVKGCGVEPFRAASLLRTHGPLEPFAPGALAQPVPLPDPARYQPQGRGWSHARRQAAREEAELRYAHDLEAARHAEEQRTRQLDAYRRQYDAWAAGVRAETDRHNDAVRAMEAGLRDGDAETVVEYFTAALYASTAWPEEFPRQVSAAYDRGAAELVLEWELPPFEVVPEFKSVRYVASADEEREVARPVTQRRALYREALAQSVLLVLRDVFAADEFRTVRAVRFNGFAEGPDPATGRHTRVVLASVAVERDDFEALNLELVSPVDCLVDGLRGQLSTKPDQLAAVPAVRRPAEVGTGVVVSHGGGEEPDLFEMDPLEFEELVAELFRARGMRALTTIRSGDGGVDVDALDPDPISGGKIVVQVKRYRNTVPPTAVRDLYGTVQDQGANKGLLVTTSGFGNGSRAFANGKPLQLVSGPELVELLHRYGLRGRLGPRTAVPEQRTGGTASAPGGGDTLVDASADPDANTLGMTWAGDVALDVCALVCRGTRVLSDDHFVFFNNPRTPDGSVAMVEPVAGARAAVRVGFDGLPPGADRLVLVAAVDPVANPESDLSGFTDAGIRLRDASGTELDRLEVSDGRPGETALVLGSFRRREGGDWDFVVGGKGYRGGLEALVEDFGIEVE
ncbi:restriction endonuclease [Streptomyces sp. 8L]|uniref:restriction endonuclease n=1 Tax=Streptomyces sp. 8L TaxID=2877242 RepID=UPI001CD37A10|nr:restriction endonuclease [Streptomyces sp. 8L]MCA1219741.1 restriction endonuclease [Streptomyces sp. 8L]